jgi:hypothetical protein
MYVGDVKFVGSHIFLQNTEWEAAWVLRAGLDDFGEEKNLLPLLGSKHMTIQFVL